MAKIADKIRDLTTTKDLYTLSLFLLWKMSDIPEYSTTAQLAYILDKKSLLNICDFLGGQTIKIPTTQELIDMFYTIEMYQLINIDNVPIDDVVKKIKKTNNSEAIKRILDNYNKLLGLLKNYEVFGSE